MALPRVLAVAPLALLMGGCSLIEADPHRFERWAEAVAAVPVTAEAAGLRGPVGGPSEAGRAGLRPGLRIDLVEPEVLRDARADGFPAVMAGPLEAGIEAGARAAADAAVQGVVRAVSAPEPAVSAARGLTVQLGAFSSRARAEGAWLRLSGAPALAQAAPVYETIERNGRVLYRLRAGPVRPSDVGPLCRAAGAGDWCASTARS